MLLTKTHDVLHHGKRAANKGGRLVGWLEFNIPFQHKYGYIREERSGMESYPLIQ